MLQQVLEDNGVAREDRGVPPSETDPLLPQRQGQNAAAEPAETWTPPRGFLWAEIALFSNVFLAGFDGTVTASTYAAISSDFLASNLASLITTSYLLTSTAAQPLYGRFSDLFGRRVCFLIATSLFGIGCLGCSAAKDIIFLDMMRAVTGIGGGGLMTMATIINSDLVPPKHRGMYQALQNTVIGLGATCGACLGGFISDFLGWRFCFLLQVPIAVMALVVGVLVVKDIPDSQTPKTTRELGGARGPSAWSRVDLLGSFALVFCLALQTAALSLVGNGFSWTDPNTLLCFCGSLAFLLFFLRIEATTSAVPILPLEMLYRADRAALLIANAGLGIAVYGVLFLMPLFFQSVFLDTPSQAGFRLIPPSIATPIGGIAAGLIMARRNWLIEMTRVGILLLVANSALLLCMGMKRAGWEYSVAMMLGNFGQGMAFPASLFAFIRTVERRDHAAATSVTYLTRSMGSIWGVAAVSTITQNALVSKLGSSLAGYPDKEEIIESLRRSVDAIRQLSPETQGLARIAYYESCHNALWFLMGICAVSAIASFLIRHPKN